MEEDEESTAPAEAVEARDPGVFRLSLPFCTPRVALSETGEFLLRLVPVDRILLVEGVELFLRSLVITGLGGTLVELLEPFLPESSTLCLFSP